MTYALLEIAVLKIVLVNAALAMLLAVVVYAVTRLWRNAHVARVLWLLVLLKLVTPPLVDLPVPDIAALDGPSPVPDVGEVDDSVPAPELPPLKAYPAPIEASWANDDTLPDAPVTAPPAPVVIDEPADDIVESPAHAVVTSVPPADVTSDDRARAANWPAVLLTTWLVGSILCALVAVVRITRFRRVLAEAREANGRVLELCQSAARQLGLKRFPRILVAEGNFTPLVWPVGRRSTILLPRTLAGQLGDDELTTLVAHELAHLARRDHWVRWFELVCTVLYWWHPAVWWARRELSAAEDVCCDALVLARFPDQAGCYAEALVKAIEHAANRRTMPVLASGLGERRSLRQRITMVVHETLPRRMSWPARLSICALGIAVLSITLTAAPPDDEPTDLADDAAAASKNTDDVTVEEEGERASELEPTSEVGAIVPVKIKPGDLLQISVLGTPGDPARQVFGIYRVEPSGKLALGPAFGRVSVVGLTLEAAEAAVHAQLSKSLLEPQVMITWAEPPSLGARSESERVVADEYKIKPGDAIDVRVLGTPDDPVSEIWREYHVEPSGMLPLGPAYGRIKVAGLTLEEAEAAIQKFLGQILLEPQVQITLPLSTEASAGAFQSVTGVSAPVESIGVLKIRIERAKEAYDDAQDKFARAVLPRTELLDAKAEYEILQQRLKQTERILATRRLAVDMARAEYDQALEVNKKTPAAISALEVRRLYYQLQLAIARVNEIAENSMPLGGKHSAPGNAGAGTTPQEPGFELVYDGKTFSQWERLARTEVALEALKRVIEAIAALGRRDADPQRAIDVLKWIAETAEVKVGQSGAAEFRTANEAVEALVGFGEPAAAALIELIKSDSPEARQSAASNVTRLGESAQEAIPALIEATRSDDGSTRNVALQSLGRIGLNRGDVIAALKASLDDDAPRVRSTAAVALAQIGTADEIAAAIPTLREHLAKVAALPPKSDWPPSVPFIGGFDPNDESDEWRRDATSAGYTLVALYILDEHGTTPEDREVLAKYVRSPDATSMVSQRSFFRVGPDSPEYETLTRLRREAGLPAPGVFPSIERQQPPKPDGAKTSSQTPTSQPELVYGGKTFSEWERLARTEVAPEALQSVITALAALGHRDEPDRAVAALTSIAEKARPSADSPSDDDVFNPVMIKLYEFGESGQAAYVRLLTPLLTDPNHMRRRQAVSALAQIDAAAALQSTIPELLHILNEDPEIRRDEVIRALVNVGGNRDEVLAAIRQRLDADDQATQVAAHFALATIGTDEDVRSILPFLRRQLDTVSQMNVGNVFARMESGHLPVVINGLWRMGSKDDRELLKQFANAEAGKYAGEFEPNVQTTHPDAAHQAVEIIKQLRGELTTGDADDSPPDIPALPDESGLLRDTSGRVVGIWGIGPVPVAATR